MNPSGNHSVYFWINPALGTQPATGSASISRPASLASGLIDTLSISGLNDQTSVDEIRFGGSWESVGGAAPSTSPTAPSGLSATLVGNNQINLSWTDNASNESSFRIERSLNGSSGWTLVGTAFPNRFGYSDTGLTAGTTYYYRVCSLNVAGNSTYSAAVSATTTGGVIAPTLTQVTPASGPAAGGTSLTLTGTAFTGATSVSVGGAAASSFTVVNATTITATTPAGTPGLVGISVTTPGGTASLPLSFTYLSGLQSWFSGYGLPIDGTGDGAPAADPDGDGVSNFLEYALGTSPLDSTEASMPGIALSGDRLGVSFTRVRADINYMVEATSDLIEWTNVTYTPVAVGQPQTVQDSVDLSTSNPPRRFLRLRVTSQ
ncbi:MAG: IPT/TIG domain-containing protein [Burkholderiales bacterium]|nr:IPT/TIG domain-containing protein [Opitutaceae bacterium]